MRLLALTLVAGLLAGCFRDPPPELTKFIPPPAPEPVQDEPTPAVASDEPAPMAEISEPEPEPEVTDLAPPPPAATPTQTAAPAVTSAAPAPTLIGSWRLINMIRNGEPQMPPGMDLVITFEEGGTTTMSMSSPQMPEPMSRQGTWSTSGDDSITITFEGDSQTGTYTLTRTTLTINIQEGQMELQRL
jgi:hypothetical protein